MLANYPGKLDPISARLVVRELYLELFGVAETTLKEGQIPEFLGFRQNPKESFRKLNSRANDMRRFKKLKVFKHFGYTFEQLSQKTRFEVEYIFSLCEEDEQRSPGVSLDLD